MARARRRTNPSPFDRGSRLWDAGRLRPALNAFMEGAREGDPSCQLNVGYFYDVGLGTRRDVLAALKWYKVAHKHDATGAAANNVATIFRGRGNRPQAISWFKRAIARGNIDAALPLAQMYLERPGGKLRALRYLHMVKSHPGVAEDTGAKAKQVLRGINQHVNVVQRA